MCAAVTPRGWCPPTVDGQQRYRWTISFEPTPGNWSEQSELIGGPPANTDLVALLTGWFQKRGGPAAWWRLEVSPIEDDAAVVAQVKVKFTEPVQPEVRRLGKKPPAVAGTFWTTTILEPPSPAQLAAWAKRDAESGAVPPPSDR